MYIQSICRNYFSYLQAESSQLVKHAKNFLDQTIHKLANQTFLNSFNKQLSSLKNRVQIQVKNAQETTSHLFTKIFSTHHLIHDQYKKGMDALDRGLDYEAFTLVKKAAKLGHLQAQIQLGKMYFDGIGCEENAQKTFHYIHLAANQNDASAQATLADLYLMGHGVKKNYKQACKYYSLAANQGYVKALNALGHFYVEGYGSKQPNYKEAFNCYKQAADQMDANACYHLGMLYKNGLGTDQNIEQALVYLQKAATLQQPEALTQLGLLYLEQATTIDEIHEAVNFLNHAVQLGDEEAAIQLDFIKNKLLSLSDDVKILQQQAEMGNAQAKISLGNMYLQGKKVPQDLTKAFSYFKSAAHANDQELNHIIGLCYLDGIGTEQNLKKARKYFTLAADLGHESSASYLKTIQEIMIQDAQSDVETQSKIKKLNLLGNELTSRQAA